MRVNWFFTSLVVTVVSLGMINIPNASAEKCEGCGGGGGGGYYDVMQKTNVTALNSSYNNKATKSQLLSAAADLSAYATSVNESGGMATLQQAVLQNLEQIEQMELDAGKTYTIAQSFGATFPESALAYSITQFHNLPNHAKDVQAAITYIQTYGLYSFFQEAVSVITTFADTLPNHFQPHSMNLSVPAQIFVDGALVVAAGLAAFGGPLGLAAAAGIGLGCAILVFVSDF
jgi:hypothetical protein